MDLITDESSGISNAGWTGREDLALLYQILPLNVGPVVKRGFFVPWERFQASPARATRLYHQLENTETRTESKRIQ
jgi:hypothetical protein